MNVPLTDLAKRHSKLLIISATFLPVVYIVFLLTFNYQNTQALHDSSIKRFQLDIEKQAKTLAYFFLESKYDVRSLADSVEVNTYFANRDMGMSEQYGLKVSLFGISQAMKKIRRSQTINGDIIYDNFALMGKDGILLAQARSRSRSSQSLPGIDQLAHVTAEPELLLKKNGNGHEILLAAPCFYKKQFYGWIIAWLNMDSLHKNFMESLLGRSSKRLSLTLANGEFIRLQEKTLLPFFPTIPRETLAEVSKPLLISVVTSSGADSQMFLTRIQIQPLPLYLTALVEKEEIMGNIEGWQFLVGTGAFIFLLLLGLLLFGRAQTRHLILEARFIKSEKENEERYRKLFESSSDAILIVKNAQIMICNQKTSELVGMDRHIIIDQPFYCFCPDTQPDGRRSKDKAMKKLTLALAEPQFFELTLKTSDNQLIETEVNMTALVLESEACVQVIIRDITQRKQAEAEKLIAQEIANEHRKHALIGRIAGKMAHDFNNILGIIMGNAELAIFDCPDNQIKKTLQLIFDQTVRGKNLTKNLVAFAKDQEPQQEFFSINEKIDLVLNLMRKDLDGIELLEEKSPGLPELLADPGMIENTLVNLIQNSIHATSMIEYPKITVRTYRCDNNICFEIEDNGCGISKENLANIYDPSFTLKGSRDITASYKSDIKGTGYGMCNVNKYITQHNGIISIESNLGSGAKFVITLPIIKKELTGEEKTEVQAWKSHFGKTILLVEDETTIADVQHRILTQEPCNHKVDIANNGQAAINLLEKNRYDLVSLDYILPGKINGMDVYHHIRASDEITPILFISGNIEFLESIKELKQKDARIDHLSKPCQNKDYLNGINELFERISESPPVKAFIEN